MLQISEIFKVCTIINMKITALVITLLKANKISNKASISAYKVHYTGDESKNYKNQTSVIK